MSCKIISIFILFILSRFFHYNLSAIYVSYEIDSLASDSFQNWKRTSQEISLKSVALVSKYKDSWIDLNLSKHQWGAIHFIWDWNTSLNVTWHWYSKEKWNVEPILKPLQILKAAYIQFFYCFLPMYEATDFNITKNFPCAK